MLMEKRFKYHFDKRSQRITILIFVLIGLIVAALFYFGHGNYMPAWFISFVVAVSALYVLSIPRYIEVRDDALEIHCILEMTRIHASDLNALHKVERSELRGLIPLLGSYGFFGYYGYYLNLRKWELVKVYAGEWDHFVEIEDIYEQKYLISCRQADKLIEAALEINRRYLQDSHTAPQGSGNQGKP